MGNTPSTIQKANYEDIQNISKYNNDIFLINTLPLHEQSCLIINTINLNEEENVINSLIKNASIKIGGNIINEYQEELEDLEELELKESEIINNQNDQDIIDAKVQQPTDPSI